MAREMKMITATCACCGNKQNIEIIENISKEDSSLHLMEYSDFKYVPCNRCEECGYCHYNIEKLIGKTVKHTVESDPYQFVLNNGFIDGFEDLNYQEYLNTNVANLDAMAMLYELEGKTSLTYAKLKFRIASIKSALRGEYAETMYGLDEDDAEFLSYQKLLNKLTEQINDSYKKCYETLIKLDLKYPYEIIFASECLTNNNEYKKAKELINNLKKHFVFDKDLQAYVDNFLTEVEVI